MAPPVYPAELSPLLPPGQYPRSSGTKKCREKGSSCVTAAVKEASDVGVSWPLDKLLVRRKSPRMTETI
jgi:hypothetical protein